MLKCNLCNVDLRDNYQLLQHKKSNNEWKFCIKIFESKVIMKHHVKVCVEGEKLQRECGQCHKHKGHYEVHVKGCGLDNKTVSEVMCYICFSNKKFSSNTNLVNHLHQHEKEKLYQCPIGAGATIR